MTVVETVLFSATAELKSYVLSESDGKGKSWDLSKWGGRGEGEIRILKPSGGVEGNIRVVMKGVGVSNKGKVLTNHLVHPETVFRVEGDGKSRMFWVQDEVDGESGVDTCLEVVFCEQNDAEEFERQYTNCQETMEKLHKSSESEWRYQGVVEEEPKRAVLAAKSAVKKEVDPNNLYPSSSSEEEDDDESECSEISLDETDEDEQVERKPMIIPSFKTQGKLWKCNGCTTPNPESAKKCLCCELPRGEIVEKKGSAVTVNFAAMNSPAKETTTQDKPSFSFASNATTSSSKPSFDFGGSSNTTASDSKTAFSFGEPTKPTFAFASKSSEASTSFNFGDIAKGGSEVKQAAKASSTEDAETEKENKPKPSAYPPMETMKKVEQVVPGVTKTASPYPPMETMKKVDQEFGAGKTKSSSVVQPSAAVKSTTNKGSAYPPMETMKKVEQVFGTSKTETKPTATQSVPAQPAVSKSSAYPPMETMKKVEQQFSASSTNKKSDTASTTTSAYPPAETMQKVTQLFGKPKATEEKQSTALGGLSSSFGSSTSPSPFAAAFSGKGTEDNVSPGLFSGNKGSQPTSLFGNTLAASRTLFGGTSEPKDVSAVKSKLVKFYEKINPGNLAKVDMLLEKYKGREDTLFDNLAKKYELSEEKRREHFGPPVEKSGFGLPMNGSSTFASTPPGLSGFSAMGSALSTSQTVTTPASTSIRATEETLDEDSSEDENEDGESRAPQTTPAQTNLFSSPSTTSTPTFAAPTMSSSFGFSATSQSTNQAASSTPSSGFGASSGVAFGQPATLGSSAPAFGVSAPPTPQVASTGAGFGGEQGGFAAFASGQQTSSGFGSLASSGESSFLNNK